MSECEPRKIIHVDMDAFFASVEQRDHPELRGRPVAVGGSRQRGVVAAASYEARRFGVRSAMPSMVAARRCPDLVFVPPRFEVYRAVSAQIRTIFQRYSSAVEPLSLDEAYLDVSDDRLRLGSALAAARNIKAEILAETGLTASAGVSYNKFLAKIASDQNKPDGIFVIRPEQGADFVAGLPVRRFHGVGPKTAERMARFGIHLGADLRARDMAFLQTHFGSAATYLYNAARGIDSRPVRSQRLRKSVGHEQTFAADILSEEALRAALARIVESTWQRAQSSQVLGRTLTLKLRYSDFRQVTRRRSCERYIQSAEGMLELAQSLLSGLLPLERGVRLLGVSLSGLWRAEEGLPAVAEPLPDAEQRAFDF
ncbi:MAG: DNA polymerase IV [Halioglobus sp.]